MSQTHSQTNPEIGDSQSIVGNELTIGQSKKRKSIAWNHFDEVGEKAVCKHCKKKLSIGPGIGTTHLKRHIEKTCKKIDEEERVLFTLGQRDDLLPSAKFDPELTRDLMTMLFIDAEIPFSVIESRFWEPAMRSLRPEYRAVGRQTLRNDCVKVFKAGSGLLMEEFEALDSHVSFTSDI
ncbi:zinc finger BED domain-containing protein RICESLEEPER 4-like [Carex rostrata]